MHEILKWIYLDEYFVLDEAMKTWQNLKCDENES